QRRGRPTGRCVCACPCRRCVGRPHRAELEENGGRLLTVPDRGEPRRAYLVTLRTTRCRCLIRRTQCSTPLLRTVDSIQAPNTICVPEDGSTTRRGNTCSIISAG